MTLTASGVGPRTLPRGLAAVVETLELDQVRLITAIELERLRCQLGVATPAKVLAARLREHGWLLKTPRRGVYEFAPGAHAGALSRGDATLSLQSALAARPDMAAGLTMQSAAWARGDADRLPQRLEIAAATPAAARSLARVLGDDARVTVFTPQLPWEHRRGAPTLSAESLVVHMAARPRDVRSWTSALEWLPDVATAATAERLQAEIAGRPDSVATRTAYLLSGLRPDLAAKVSPARTSGKVYFGSRGPLLRHDQVLQVADTVLPFDPRTLTAVA